LVFGPKKVLYIIQFKILFENNLKYDFELHKLEI